MRISELISINQKIEEAELKIWQMLKDLSDAEELKAIAVNKISQSVTAEKDINTGKPIFTNELSRKSEIELRSRASEEIQNCENVIKQLLNDIEISKIKNRCMIRRLEIYKLFKEEIKDA